MSHAPPSHFPRFDCAAYLENRLIERFSGAAQADHVQANLRRFAAAIRNAQAIGIIAPAATVNGGL